MKESEEIFRQICASAKDAIIMIDNESIISFWNKAAEEIFGHSRENAVGKELASLIIPEGLREAYMIGFAKFKDTGHGPVIGKTVRLTAVRRDGAEFPIELSLSSVKVQDEWSAVGIIRDITERNESERRLNAQHAVTRVLSDSSTLKEASQNILQAVCEALNWDFGVV